MSEEPLTGVKRAAILMMSLGNTQAAGIMKHLGPKQVQRLGAAMATLSAVDKSLLDTVLQDFLMISENQTSLGVDANKYIREVLVQALGADKAEGLIERIFSGANTQGLDTLKWMDPRAIADIIRFEHPQIQCLVLSYIDSDQAAAALAFFDERTRIDLMMRIADLDTVQPAALQELNDIMEKQFSGNTAGKTRSVGGVKTAAGIMNFLDTSIETQIMQQIKEKDSDLAQKVQELMFVFENLLDIDDRGIQTILKGVSSDILLVALKGCDLPLKTKIFSNMSRRAAELLKDDLESKGPVRVSEVKAAQKEILAITRKMADAGEIVLGGKGEELV